ncbi:MAG TPA: isochorismatase family cysteine hydrolase [Stellaceae bacterium]|nr:isochorismatase family cysteine hydrolase [Stellaceae bacterium]
MGVLTAMHKIAIPEDVLAGVVAQRGSLVRYPELAGPRTALVVIDLQNVFMLPGMPVEVPAAREIVPNVNRLAAAMRAAGGKVVWVKMTLAGETESWSVFFDTDPRGAALEHMTPGAHGHDLHAELDLHAQDLVVEKRRFSAFIQGSSELDAILRERGIDTAVIVGTLTNVCCESTARDAMMLNYRIVFVSDANAALTDAEHNATLTTIVRVFGDVALTDDVIGRLLGRSGAAA